MQKFAILERKLNFIVQHLENPGRAEANPIIQDEDFSLLPNFPLTTVEKLKDFDKQLRSITVRQQFVSVLLFANNKGDTGLFQFSPNDVLVILYFIVVIIYTKK